MLGTSLVDSPPNLFNAPDVSHLDSLNFGIETVMHLIVTGRFTNLTVLFRVCVARIKGTNSVTFYKFFGGLPPSFLFERSLIFFPYYR